MILLCRLSWSCSARAASERAPMRSGRPTPPEKSVSPVRTNHGSEARVLSVTRIERLSGVCPGVWRIESTTLPSACRSPSSTSRCGNSTGADLWKITGAAVRSEEHTSELQSPCNLVCRLLLEKKKQQEDKQHARTAIWC